MPPWGSEVSTRANPRTISFLLFTLPFVVITPDHESEETQHQTAASKEVIRYWKPTTHDIMPVIDYAAEATEDIASYESGDKSK
jgi:hypothetical protein